MRIDPEKLLLSIFSHEASTLEFVEMILFAERLKGFAADKLFSLEHLHTPRFDQALEKLILETGDVQVRQHALEIRIQLAEKFLLFPLESFYTKAIKRFIDISDELCLESLIDLAYRAHDLVYVNELLTKAITIPGVKYVESLKPKSQALFEKTTARLKEML